MVFGRRGCWRVWRRQRELARHPSLRARTGSNARARDPIGHSAFVSPTTPFEHIAPQGERIAAVSPSLFPAAVCNFY